MFNLRENSSEKSGSHDLFIKIFSDSIFSDAGDSLDNVSVLSDASKSDHEQEVTFSSQNYAIIDLL